MLIKSNELLQKDEMPELDIIDSFYLKCFTHLNTARSAGMGVGHIPINIIFDYASRYGLDDSFVEIILGVDREFIEDGNRDKQKDNRT